MPLSDHFHTFFPTGPLHDPRPKWLLCEPFRLPGHHCCQPLLHSIFPSDGGPRVWEEYAHQHGPGQVSKDVIVESFMVGSDVDVGFAASDDSFFPTLLGT